MTILLLSADLGCLATVSGAANRAGHELRTSMNAAAIDDKLTDVGLVVLDLNMASLDPGELVPRLRSRLTPDAAILAFGPHVHESKLAAAADAGCDRVLSRGQFHARLDALLGEPLA